MLRARSDDSRELYLQTPFANQYEGDVWNDLVSIFDRSVVNFAGASSLTRHEAGSRARPRVLVDGDGDVRREQNAFLSFSSRVHHPVT